MEQLLERIIKKASITRLGVELSLDDINDRLDKKLVGFLELVQDKRLPEEDRKFYDAHAHLYHAAKYQIGDIPMKENFVICHLNQASDLLSKLNYKKNIMYETIKA